ncbi:MAG: hydroxyacylglutathione hydrolase family protein [Planctomycetota bacterium]|nr:hydroxyacylglutathione hydrolase family protein [Planctomycetota bacterium]
MDFVFEQIRVGGDRNFGYLIGDRSAGVAALVDPSFSPEAVVERATAQGLKPAYIVNTHGHGDHINGNAKAKELTGAPVCAFHDSPVAPDEKLYDGSILTVGDYALRFLHTPGHCADHLVIHLEEQACALTGDLIFVGKVGGTGSEEAARIEWASLQRVLKELPGETTLWPGHDYGCRPASTLAWERANNPFLGAPDLASFLRLKLEWPEFKKKHGLK